MSPATGIFHLLLIADRRAAASIGRSLAGSAFPHRSTAFHELRDARRHLDRLEDPETPAADLPHLVILDPDVPGPEWVAFVSRIKDHPILKTVPVVVLPAGSADNTRNPAASARTRALIETLHDAWQLSTR